MKPLTNLKNQGQLKQSKDVELFDMSNNRLETAGRVDLKFQFGEIAQLDQEFIILEDMIPSCILGIDTIEKDDFIIDGKLKTVYRVHMDEEGEKDDSKSF